MESVVWGSGDGWSSFYDTQTDGCSIIKQLTNDCKNCGLVPFLISNLHKL